MRATGAVRLRDDTSGLTIAFALDGAQEAPLAAIDGVVIYAGALARDGADLVHLASSTGIEDFVYFDREPAERELRYVVDASGVAGLRLVSNTLEFLDPEGTPRLRVQSPYVLDSLGRRHRARLHVNGCTVDTDPRPPWGRPVTSPGAGSCTVLVEWRGAPTQHPVLVDPRWEGTAGMLDRRTFHAATLLDPNAHASRVLITGGFGRDRTALVTAEFYEPLSRTFASAADMAAARGHHTGTLVEPPPSDPPPEGPRPWDVLIVGGSADQDGPPFTTVGPVERYDHTSGRFIDLSEAPEHPLTLRRVHHTATRFGAGKVLIAGGADSPGQALNSAYVYTYDHGSPTLTLTKSLMLANRAGHGATLLASEAADGGDVLLTGGIYVGIAQTSAEVFRAGTDDFELVRGTESPRTFPTMLHSRAFHTATRLRDGRVLLAGGTSAIGSDALVRDSAELFIDSGGTRGFARIAIPMSGVPGMPGRARYGHTATLDPAGHVVLVGGFGGPAGDPPDPAPGPEVSFVDSFCPRTETFTPYLDMLSPTAGHTATLVNAGEALLAGRSILIAGGGNTAKADAYLLLHDLGEPCATDQDCASGHCFRNTSGGICCDMACTGECETCIASRKADGSGDGRCGPASAGTPTSVTCVDELNADGVKVSGIRTQSACDGAGHSVSFEVQSCAPFLCNDAGTDCATTCRPDAACAAAGWCSFKPGVVSVPSGCPLHSAPGGGGAGGSGGTGGAGGTSGSGGMGGAGGTGGTGGDGGSGGAAGAGAAGAVTGTGGARGAVTGVDPCYAPDGAGSAANGTGGGGSGAGDAGAGGPGAGGGGAAPGDALGVCVCKQPLGATCEDARECASNFCVDGRCCDASCNGPCEACATEGAPGLCRPIGTPLVHQPPRRGHDPCPSDPGCEGWCDGTSTSECTYPNVGHQCGAPSCVDGVALGYACDADHRCKEKTDGCKGFLCDETTRQCKEECTLRQQDCIEDAICDNGRCVEISGDTCDGGHFVVKLDGDDEDCTPYTCSDSACRTSCETFKDCVDGFVCSQGACVEPLDPPRLSSCNLPSRGHSDDGWGSWSALLVALAAGFAGRCSRRR